MTSNPLDSAPIIFKGTASAITELERYIQQHSLSISLMDEGDDAVDGNSYIYRTIEDTRGFYTAQQLDEAKAATQAIEGLSMTEDSSDPYDEEWERVVYPENGDTPCFACPYPLFPLAFSLYADACTDIDRLASRIHELIAALVGLTHEVSLEDDYDALFPEYAHLHLEDIDNWDADDYALDEERALDEQDYGGWWGTWANGNDTSIEKLNSGKCLIAAIGKLLDSRHANRFNLVWQEQAWLRGWVMAFVSLIDKHGLWFEDDETHAIRFAVASSIESEIRAVIRPQSQSKAGNTAVL